MGLFSKKWWNGLLSLWLGILPSGMALAETSDEQLLDAIRGGAGNLLFSTYALDLGQVKQGENLEFRFAFREEGARAVSVLGVHQECGCLEVSLKPGQNIRGGTQSELVIRVETKHFIGALDKEVIILTNEDRDRPHIFRLKANIERLILIQPPLVELDPRRTGDEAQSVRVRIQSTSKQTLHIEKLLYNEDTLDVQYYPVREAWEMQIRWKGPSATQLVDEMIVVVTENPAMNLKIPVVGLAAASRLSLSAKP